MPMRYNKGMKQTEGCNRRYYDVEATHPATYRIRVKTEKEENMVTKDMVRWALNNGVMEIMDDRKIEEACGIVCHVGKLGFIDSGWFYFDTDADDYETAEDYKLDNSEDSIAEKIVETLEAIAEDCGDTEPKLYEAIIREAGYHERA